MQLIEYLSLAISDNISIKPEILPSDLHNLIENNLNTFFRRPIKLHSINIFQDSLILLTKDRWGEGTKFVKIVEFDVNSTTKPVEIFRKISYSMALYLAGDRYDCKNLRFLKKEDLESIEVYFELLS